MKTVNEILKKLEILKKWSPILDILKIEDEGVRMFAAEYAENYSIKETFPISRVKPLYDEMNYPESKVDADNIGQNLLPLSIKIISMLNLKDKNLFRVESPEGITDIVISEDLEDINEYTLEKVNVIESSLIKKLASYLNKELETKDNLYIYNLASSILSIKEVNSNKTRMTLVSRCKVE